MARVLVLVVCAVLLAGCSRGGGSSGVAAPPVASPTVAQVQESRALSAEQVAKKLKAAGVPLRVIVVYTAETDPNHLMGRPGGNYTSKLAFADSRVKPEDVQFAEKDALERGGSIEVFESAGDAQTRAADIDGKIKAVKGLVPPEYHYLRGGVLVRVTGNLSPSQAKTYGRALTALR
jgi:hypothetical protein